MRELRFIAVSDDGSSLILLDDDTESLMTLPLDERVQAAARGDRHRLGQAEQQESTLRPREIQARVRSGQTVEEVAAAAGAPLAKVERFAGPVLAERAHVADRAQNAVIRGSATDAPNRPLSEVVGEWVSRSDVDPETVEWDAFRRDDGKWQVTAVWILADRAHEARFLFDPTGRSVVPDDSEARRIAGLLEPGDAESDEPAPAGQTRLSVVGAKASTQEQPKLSIAPGHDDDDEYDEEDETPVRPAANGSLNDDQPTAPVPLTATRTARGRRRGRTAPAERLRLTDIADNVEVDEPVRQASNGDAPGAEAPQPPRKRSKKPSVPSWDEIMFGRADRPE